MIVVVKLNIDKTIWKSAIRPFVRFLLAEIFQKNVTIHKMIDKYYILVTFSLIFLK